LTQDTISGVVFTLLGVQVHGAPANDTLTVKIGPAVVGTLTTDSNGNGKVIFSSNPVGSQLQLPATFPVNVASGTPALITDAASLNLSGSLGNPPPAPLGTLLTAQLTSTATTATANIQYAQFTANGTATTLLAVQVLGATATDTLTVTLSGVAVGTLTTDANGNGILVLSSNPQGQQQALPANFPTSVASGATVSITDASTLSLTGTLAAPPKPTQPPPPPPPTPVANGTVLVAQLTGTGTTATSSVQFTQDTVNGTTYTSFSVHVSGAPASDTLSVSIGGVVVGQITTDANGNGTLCLSSNPQGKQSALPTTFPTNVASGTAVSVTDANGLSLTGTLAAPTPPAPTPWHNSSNPLDVIGSGGPIIPEDALVLINYLNTQGPGALPSAQPVGAYDLDVLGDNSIAPIDALKIIDYLNTHPSGSSANSSSSSTDAASSSVTPQVAAATGTASTTTATTAAPLLAIGAGLTSGGSNGAAGSLQSSATASSSAASSSTASNTAVQMSSSLSTSGTVATTRGTMLGVASGPNEASIDAVLSDPLFDFAATV
jgi:hypothetical protein